MAKILVYNNSSNRMETYYKGEKEAMPYNTNRTLLVSEFRGKSESDILWTDLRTMQSWNSFRYLYGRPIFIGFAFRRPYEGGHSNLSQHYAGLAFDSGQNLDLEGRTNLRNQAYNSGVWNYVEPLIYTPRWVHFDDRWVQTGYPLTRQGSRGPYVCIAQDCLTYVGFNPGNLDGIFGPKTRAATVSYQTSRGLVQDGIIGPNTWNSLMAEVVGNGAKNNITN